MFCSYDTVALGMMTPPSPESAAPLLGVPSRTDEDSVPASESDNSGASIAIGATDGDGDAVDYFPNPSINHPSALETAQFWAENTSIHGMYYCLERGHFRRWKLLAWRVVATACATFLLWAVAAEFIDYSKYNVDTSTETVIPTSLDFPNVTLCNAGGVDASRQEATGIAEPRNEDELVAISQPLGEFILYTQFNDEEYKSEAELAGAWTPVVTSLGLCFSFAAKERSVFVPGISSGLLVHAWLDQASYPEAAHWAGVHVSVTDDGQVRGSAVNHQGPGTVLVPPGAVSFVSIKMQEYQREGEEPWKRCVDSTETIDQCREECIMAAVRRKCGCREVGDAADPQLYDYCGSSDRECTSAVGDDDIAVCRTCSIPPCRERVYSAAYSAGKLSRRAIEGAGATKNGGAPVDDVPANLVVIHVNFASIQYERTTETKSTSRWQLFSNLGGSFGFFMGISVISLVELFVELIGLRLLPRLWGKKSLYGIGQRKFD